MSDRVRQLIAEFIGTFALIFVGAGAIVMNGMGANYGVLGVALAHGLVLAIGVSALGHVSGAHFNPAVSIALAATGNFAWNQVPGYIVAQLAGGAAGGFLLRAVYPADALTAAQFGTPTLAAGVTLGQGILIEAVLTFFLVLAIFGTAVDARGPKLGGFGIGLVLIFDILIAGNLTGAAMNPARTFGPALAGGIWNGHLAYWFGPIIGALVAAFVYKGLLPARTTSPGMRRDTV